MGNNLCGIVLDKALKSWSGLYLGIKKPSRERAKKGKACIDYVLL